VTSISKSIVTDLELDLFSWFEEEATTFIGLHMRHRLNQ